jgi:predicted lipoprotein
MKRNFLVVPAALLLLTAGFLYSCSKSGGGGGSNPGGGGTTTGKDSILTNIGNNIILPAYASLSVSVNSLDSAILDFNAGPGSVKLKAVQSLFKSAYINWQSASEFNYFGPASSIQPILSGLNIFPTDSVKIESNITAANNNVTAFANTAAKGFPALDYILFGGTGANLTGFTTDANAANRKAYLAAVSADIKSEVTAVVKGWSASGGNYIATFLNGTGNSISSSLGLLLNSMIQDLEITKNDRLGIPLGKMPAGQPILPKELEAYFSGISAQLATAQIKAMQDLYLGIGVNGNGPGLQDYVIKANPQYNGGPLDGAITTNFVSAITGLQGIPDPLSATIQSNPAPATAVYTTTQLLVVLLKTDMASSLGVLITFGDNDGD